ncbi:MAG: hypothetical protein F6K41_08365 [Symploca sp. SIO3E6]|nr:hypothetical protein [Caldora sp. SIO3E6]
MAKLLFEYSFDEREQDEAKARGYLNHVKVELNNGNRYAIVFYDYIRLGQDLEEEIKLGHKFISEPGMIILEEVTLDNMQSAINRLEQEHYFDSLLQIQDLIPSLNLAR